MSLRQINQVRFLDKVEGKSGFGKSSNWKAFAKDAALKQAERLHVSQVFDEYFSERGLSGLPWAMFSFTATAICAYLKNKKNAPEGACKMMG